MRSQRPFPPARRRLCVFEYVYFARPDSVVEGRGVYEVSKRIGAELARETAVPADVVVPVPDSGVPAAIGYAQGAGLPFELGIIRNHYVGRTFIEPSDTIRHLGVRLKHNANRPTLEGKRVVLVDDSIVRGTTSTKIVAMVRAAGASEVHMRIASPPTTHSCFYGVDTPERGKLMAANHTVEEMARADRRRQPGVPVDRRPLPRHGRGRARGRGTPVLRRLLHRRLPDPARGLRRRGGPGPALAAARGRVTFAADLEVAGLDGRVVLITGASRGLGSRWPSPAPPGARGWSWSPAPAAPWRRSTTAAAAPARLPPRWSRSTSPPARTPRPARPRRARAARPARRAGRVRRRPRHADPGAAGRAQDLRRAAGRQPPRQRAADPRLDPLLRASRRRPRHVRHRPRDERGPGVLGRLRRKQGRARGRSYSPGPPRSVRITSCGSTSSIPARCDPAARPRFARARTRARCPRQASALYSLLPLLLPDLGACSASWSAWPDPARGNSRLGPAVARPVARHSTGAAYTTNRRSSRRGQLSP